MYPVGRSQRLAFLTAAKSPRRALDQMTINFVAKLDYDMPCGFRMHHAQNKEATRFCLLSKPRMLSKNESPRCSLSQLPPSPDHPIYKRSPMPQ